ncbi:hypothetical protein [Okeania sp. KiyG1]|nr:hypothetical protein [Okeania sp. KiyG1]
MRTHSCSHCGVVIDRDVFAFAQHPVGKHDKRKRGDQYQK